MTELILLRHGPTAAAAARAPLGHRDEPVQTGAWARWPDVRQVIAGWGPAEVVTSDLARCCVLAEELNLPCTVLPALREQDFGQWDGQPWSRVPADHPFWADPVHGVPPGGESFAACAERAWQAFIALPTEAPLLVLASAGPLRAIAARLLGLSLERALDLDWQPFAAMRLRRIGDERAVLREFRILG